MLHWAQKILLAICLSAFAGSIAWAQDYKSNDWFPVYVDGKAGYIDRSGKIVIEPQFDGASYFSEGLARVSVGRDTIFTEGFSQGFIDEAGKLVIKPQWDIVSHFSEGLAAVGYDQTKRAFKLGNMTLYTSASHTWYRWGFIDKAGNVVINTKFVDVSEFRDGIAAAAVPVMSEWKYGFIDKTGNWIIKPQFEHVSQFSEGLALVFVNGKYGFINKNGEMVIKPMLSFARDFSEGLACVKLKGDVIKPRGMSSVRNNGDYAFIDSTGKVLFKIGRGGCSSFSEGLARFSESGRYGEGFIDRSGKVVIKPKWGGQSEFSDGLKFVIMDEGKLGFIDRTGTLSLQLPFGKVDDFYRGLAQVCESYDFNAKCGYIDKTGKVVWEPTK